MHVSAKRFMNIVLPSRTMVSYCRVFCQPSSVKFFVIFSIALTNSSEGAIIQRIVPRTL